LGLSVDIEGCCEASSSPSSPEQSQVDIEFTSSLPLVEDDPKSTAEGIPIEAAEAGGLARKNDDDENGSYIELSTAVCMADCGVTMLPS